MSDDDLTCSECDAPTKLGDRFCAGCGLQFEEDPDELNQHGPVNEGKTPEELAAEKTVNRGCALVAALAVVILIAVMFSSSSSGGGSGPTSSQREAQYACHDHVDARLKAPGTSNFEDLGEAKITGNDPYTVVGWVDAENTFGAEIRTYYRCVITGTGRLTSLNFE